MSGQFLSIKEFAARRNFSEHFVRRLIKEKRIPYINSGVKIYIDDDEAIKRLRGGEVIGG